jgi:hypothetical protein
MQLPRPTYLPPGVMSKEESHLLGFCTYLAQLHSPSTYTH